MMTLLQVSGTSAGNSTTAINEPLISTIRRRDSESVANDIISANTNATSTTVITTENDVLIDVKKLVGSLYSNNAPRIALETLNGSTMTFITFMTFFVFIIAFALDFSLTWSIFNNQVYNIPFAPCSVHRTANCSSGNVWNATIVELRNVISVKLEVQNSNFSQYTNSNNQSNYITIPYTVDLWACYNPKGCGDSFSNAYDDLNSAWHYVLKDFDDLSPIEVPIDIDTDADSSQFNTNACNYTLIPNTFQNQESVPTRGVVKSYYIEVSYDPTLMDENIFLNAETITYVFTPTMRSSVEWATYFILCVFIVTCTTFVVYAAILFNMKEKWLQEQQWLLWYFIALIMYQNPIYISLLFKNSNDITAAQSYASYIFDGIGQASLFVVWLMLGDSVSKKATSRFYFYAPKILFAFIFLSVYIVMLTFQFPSLLPNVDNKESPVEAVVDWTSYSQLVFITFCILYIVLQWIWAIWWLLVLFKSHNILKRLPYMNTRYLQLSYRFFFLQAIMVTFYYFLQYSVIIYQLQLTMGTQVNDETLSDNINTVIRDQSQLVGRQLFLAVYGITSCFVYLPSSIMTNPNLQLLASTYVISEEEYDRVVAARKIVLNNMMNTLASKLILKTKKAEVYCVDLALELCNISYETYYDIPGMPTPSSFTNKALELNKYGYELIERIYDEQHETFCIVARSLISQRIVVAFRGTSCKNHWNTNMKYNRIPIDFYSLSLSHLDASDGFGEVDCDSNTANRYSSSGKAGQEIDDHSYMRGTFVEQVVKGVTYIPNMVADQLVASSAEVLRSAAANTPINSMINVCIHAGFWEAYSVVRERLHVVIRSEFASAARPMDICFCGHSLGSAISTIASVDVTINTLPRVNAYLKSIAKQSTPSPTTLGSRSDSSNSTSTFGHLQSSSKSVNSNGSSASFKADKLAATSILYSFGSPRVGNSNFVQLANKVVPDSFRTIVDGDLVPTLPPKRAFSYAHVGTEILIDCNFSGSIIIDRSFVERQLQTKWLNLSLATHSLVVYRKGLLGVKASAEYMETYLNNTKCGSGRGATNGIGHVDEIKLAISAGSYLAANNALVNSADKKFTFKYVDDDEQNAASSHREVTVEEAIHSANDAAATLDIVTYSTRSTFTTNAYESTSISPMYTFKSPVVDVFSSANSVNNHM